MRNRLATFAKQDQESCEYCFIFWLVSHQKNLGYLHVYAMLTRKILFADTIFYSDSLQKIEAKKNVHFIEEKNNIRIQSNYLLKDESKDETSSQIVLAEIIQEGDTIYIHSDTLRIIPTPRMNNQKKYLPIMAYGFLIHKFKPTVILSHLLNKQSIHRPFI